MQARLVGLSFRSSGQVPAQGQFELGLEARLPAAYLPVGHRYAGAPDQLPLGRGTGAPPAAPGRPAAAQGRPEPEIRLACAAEPRHRAARHAHDTLLQSYVLEAHERHDMDTLAARHLHETTIKYEDLCGKGAGQIGFDQVDIARATDYAAEDADITLRLHQALYPAGAPRGRPEPVYRDIEMPLLPSWHAWSAPG
jgi:DNA polymerase I